MKITLLQTDIRWHDAEANWEAAIRLMNRHPETDLYLLPEMWATGFDTTPPDTLATESQKALTWMIHEAQSRQCAIAGSLALRDEDETWRNRFVFAQEDGTVNYYDKRHLFTYGGEERHYRAGEKRVIVSWHGVRFLLQTCFDLRFPETARNSLHDSYDVLLYVANWPAARRTAWDTLLRARAIENQCYVIGVNRTGNDPQLHYNGGSAAIDPYGHTLLQLGEEEEAATAVPDLKKMYEFREKFKVLLP